MAMSSSASGTTSALFEAAWQIARLPDIDTTALTMLAGVLLHLHARNGLVSIHVTQPLVENRLTGERIEAIFLTLTGSGILTRQRRDRRGAAYDQYQIDPDRLRQVLRDAALLMQACDRFRQETAPTGQAQLIATLPDDLPLPPHVKQHILSLASTLHRLITTAHQGIIILNPFFEHEGFNRLAPALLAAAGRGVSVCIITSQATDASSINYRVLKQFWEQCVQHNVAGQFCFYEYRGLEEDRIILTSHAKAMVVDKEVAYIGSANLTEYGLSRNIEIGVILHGSEARQLYVLMKALMRVSEIRTMQK